MNPGKHDDITGKEYVNKVIIIDQSPIGRTPRSNPATYTGVFTYIREIFAQTPTAKKNVATNQEGSVSMLKVEGVKPVPVMV